MAILNLSFFKQLLCTIKEMKNITIFGGGAMATLFASHLPHNTRVHLLTKTKQQAEKINKQGLACWRGRQIIISKNVVAHHQIEKLPPSDLGVLAVKQYDVEALLDSAILNLKDEAPLLTLQNGIREWPLQHKSQIVQGVWYAGALTKPDGIVKETGIGSLHLEKKISGLIFPRVNFKNFEEEQKRKLIINSVINPLTALTGLKNGELNQSMRLTSTIRALVAEANLAIGIKTKVRAMDVMETLIRTGSNKSSMLQDIEKQKTTELEYITGPIVRSDCPTPTHDTLYALLTSMKTSD